MIYALFSASSLFAQCEATEVVVTTNTGDYSEEMSFEILNSDENIVFSFLGTENNQTYTNDLCLEDGCFVINTSDSFGDGWNGGTFQLDWDGETLLIELPDGSSGVHYFGINEEDCIPAITGCTDQEAFNYNPLATLDDGTCLDLDGMLAIQQWDTLCYGGPKDNRINFVMQNRGVSNPNDEFDDLEDLVGSLDETFTPAFDVNSDLAKTPYSQYKNFFNLYAVYWPEAPSQDEWWSFGAIKDMRDEVFLPWNNDETGWATWFSITKYGGGGGAGLDRDERVGDGLLYGAEWETLLHEFGHTMPGLPDEYTSSGEWSGGECWESGNTTGNTVRDEIPWRNWIDPSTPLPTPYTGEYENTIGAFEGALTNYFGCHRPTAKGCYMGAGGFGEGYGQDLCSPCAQRTVCFLYRYVNVIENPMPADPNMEVIGAETVTFSADVLAPTPNTQKYQWFLNGKLIAANTTTVDVTFGNCPDYELKLAVTDTTDLVRYDEKFDEFYPKPYREHIWNIDQTDISTYDLSVSTALTNANCTGEANGEILLTPSMGLPGYTFWMNQEEVQNPVTGLFSGSYTVDVVDDNNCAVTETVIIEADDLLELQICSVYEEGTGWEVVATADYPNFQDIDVEWSNGETEWSINGVEDGNYDVTATVDGCSVSVPFSLEYAGTDLVATADFYPSNTLDNNGTIYLSAMGGLPTYHVKWYDKLMADQTDDNVDQITASGTTWGHEPEMAFDNDLSNKWLHAVNSNAWIGYEFNAPTNVAYYTITSADDVPERDPLNWMLQGSADGTNWNTLDTRTNEDFPERYQKRAFLVASPTAYAYYRLFVNQSAGEDQIQLQELEFIAVNAEAPFEYNPVFDDVFTRTNLAPGEYTYEISDESSGCAENTISINLFEAFDVDGLEVIQLDDCSVTIAEPNAQYEYYWLDDEEGTTLFQTGNTFSPPYEGNFYVAAAPVGTSNLSTNRKGFAVTRPTMPEVEELTDGILNIVDPQSDEIYVWYTEAECGATSIHLGETFEPGEDEATYYVAALTDLEYPEPIDPTALPGLLLRMDAADLNGDGVIDSPSPVSSSLYDWNFPTGQQWGGGSWFAFRGNLQNGLGVADFATMWLQSMSETESGGFQTVLMAYKENALSWDEKAPMEALSNHMPRNTDASQLYNNNAPASTLNGTTYLNGIAVDPLTTANPMEFCVLGSVFTQQANDNIYYTDEHWEGQVGEILCYENALTDEQMKGVSEFLRLKWITTADLESPRRMINWDGDGVNVDELQSTAQANIKVYPNPFSNGLMVESGGDLIATVEIYNAVGTLIKSVPVNAVQYQIDLSELGAGSYFVKVGEKVTMVVKN